MIEIHTYICLYIYILHNESMTRVVVDQTNLLDGYVHMQVPGVFVNAREMTVEFYFNDFC